MLRSLPDPFLVAGDAGERAAIGRIREYLIRASPPDLIFRQRPGQESYALIVPRMPGERMLTIPGRNEADFMDHGEPGTTVERLADFISDSIESSKADHLSLPLLTHRQAQALVEPLRGRLPDWIFSCALTAISPVVENPPKEPGILRKAIERTRREGLTVELSESFPEGQIRELHRQKWGDNRSDAFFGMLRDLLDAGMAELITARCEDGRLVAAQLDILGSATRYCYYVISDVQRASGSGTAVLGVSWRRFAATEGQRVYSFGRGAERYKFQFANACREHFELRGFYSPCCRN